MSNAFPLCTRRSARVAGLLLLACLFLGGCAGFVYNRLDSLAGWYLGNLVSLDDTQRSDLRSFLQQTLEWHRRSELAQYAAFLRELSARVTASATREAYSQTMQRVEEFGKVLIARATPEASRLLLGLEPGQVDELIANLQKKSEERAKKSLKAIAGGTWHEARAKSTERQLERWTGSVSEEQRALIREAVRSFEPTTHDWLESQAHWRAALRAALDERAIDDRAPEDTGSRVLSLLREPHRAWTVDYTAKIGRNRERTLELLQRLDRSLTPAQRGRLQRELVEIAEQLEALAEP